MSLSVFEIFKIGIGPSSSHTVGPMKAAKHFLLEAKKRGLLQNKYKIFCDLYGSLALTGKGHGTDKAVIIGLLGKDPEIIDTSTIYKEVENCKKLKVLNALNEKEMKFEIDFHKSKKLQYHSNGMVFHIVNSEKETIFSETYYSIGGGFVETETELKEKAKINDKKELSLKLDIGPTNNKIPFYFSNTKQLIELCLKNNMSIAQLQMENEKFWNNEETIKSKLDKIWSVMDDCIFRGLTSSGYIDGPLNLERRAPRMYHKLNNKTEKNENEKFFDNLNWINCWALAVSEENANGGQVVTAPTNGAAGIIPSVLKYYTKFHSDNRNKIHEFLLTSAVIGMIIKHNATVSGAEGGCQAEIGASSSMAAGGLAAVLGGDLMVVEKASEIALEHFIGLTCDPVGGLVQIPCIERNAIGAVKSVNSAVLALSETSSLHKVSLDHIIAVMKQTGIDLKSKYKETSKGGIAKIMKQEVVNNLRKMRESKKLESKQISNEDINKLL